MMIGQGEEPSVINGYDKDALVEDCHICGFYRDTKGVIGTMIGICCHDLTGLGKYADLDWFTFSVLTQKEIDLS